MTYLYPDCQRVTDEAVACLDEALRREYGDRRDRSVTHDVEAEDHVADALYHLEAFEAGDEEVDHLELALVCVAMQVALRAWMRRGVARKGRRL